MRVEVNGVHLYFDVEGPNLVPDGPVMKEMPTLLLLHGGPGFDHSGFKPAFSPLADSAQLIYIDHRGNGRSDRSSSEHWTFEQWADDIAEFCNVLGIENPAVLGLSFGGMVAQAYAIRHAGQPSKLILMSTAGRMRFDRSLEAFERLGGAEVRDVAARFWDNVGPETVEEYIGKCMPYYNRTPQDLDGQKRTVMNMELLYHFNGPDGEAKSFNFLPDLGKVKCPTLVLAGLEDPITPPADSEDMLSALPADLARLEVLPDCGHGTYRDAPDATFELIRDFLAE